MVLTLAFCAEECGRCQGPSARCGAQAVFEAQPRPWFLRWVPQEISKVASFMQKMNLIQIWGGSCSNFSANQMKELWIKPVGNTRTPFQQDNLQTTRKNHRSERLWGVGTGNLSGNLGWWFYQAKLFGLFSNGNHSTQTGVTHQKWGLKMIKVIHSLGFWQPNVSLEALNPNEPPPLVVAQVTPPCAWPGCCLPRAGCGAWRAMRRRSRWRVRRPVELLTNRQTNKQINKYSKQTNNFGAWFLQDDINLYFWLKKKAVMEMGWRSWKSVMYDYQSHGFWLHETFLPDDARCSTQFGVFGHGTFFVAFGPWKTESGTTSSIHCTMVKELRLGISFTQGGPFYKRWPICR